MNNETKSTMPDVIYLQPNAGLDGETTWCDGSQFDDDVEYVRADLATNGHFKVLSDVGAERQRQIRKGYDAGNDDKKEHGQIGSHGGYLAIAAPYQRGAFDIPDLLHKYADAELPDDIFHAADLGIDEFADPRDMLVKAAALIVAEIERIDRKESGND